MQIAALVCRERARTRGSLHSSHPVHCQPLEHSGLLITMRPCSRSTNPPTSGGEAASAAACEVDGSSLYCCAAPSLFCSQPGPSETCRPSVRPLTGSCTGGSCTASGSCRTSELALRWRCGAMEGAGGVLVGRGMMPAAAAACRKHATRLGRACNVQRRAPVILLPVARTAHPHFGGHRRRAALPAPLLMPRPRGLLLHQHLHRRRPRRRVLPVHRGNCKGQQTGRVQQGVLNARQSQAMCR